MLSLCLFFFTVFLPVLQSDSVFSMSHACHPQHHNDFQRNRCQQCQTKQLPWSAVLFASFKSQCCWWQRKRLHLFDSTCSLRFHEEPSWQKTRVFLGYIEVRESREKFCCFSVNIMISWGLSQHQIQLSICILAILSPTFQITQQKTHSHHYFKMEQLIFLLFYNSRSLTLTSLSHKYHFLSSLKTLISLYLRCFVSLSLCSCLVSFCCIFSFNRLRYFLKKYDIILNSLYKYFLTIICISSLSTNPEMRRILPLLLLLVC